MELPVSETLLLIELAEYLRLPPPAVEGLVERGVLPGSHDGGRWRFHRMEVDHWVDLGMPGWDPSVHPVMGGVHEPWPVSLRGAMSRGNVLLDLSARDTGECIEQAISRFELPVTTDRQALLKAVRDRERLCSTALGNGFALPHTRRTGPRLVAADVVGLVRLRTPVRAVGLSGVEVDLLFFIFARDPASHLRLLSRATRLAQEPSLAEALRRARQPQSALRAIAQGERRIFGSAVVGSIPPRNRVPPSQGEFLGGQVTALGEPASWDGLGAVYARVRHDWHTGQRPEDVTATEVVRLVGADLQPASAVSARQPAARATRGAPGRLHDYAARVRQVVTTERARLTVPGFERVRGLLEEAGFNRALAWRLCLALRKAGVITEEPNRPYLGRRAQLLVEKLLAEVGFRAQAVEDLEAGLMIAAERRVDLGGQRLDAEVLTEACSQLARASGRC